MMIPISNVLFCVLNFWFGESTAKENDSQFEKRRKKEKTHNFYDWFLYL